MAPRCSPVSGSPSGSLRVLTLVVAMTAGCRAVLLAATAFWLAGRRLLKACIYRDGVLVFRQEGTSDRPLPVSISGARSHGPSVGCRSGCVLRHRVSPGGLFIAATDMACCCSASCSAGCTSRARISCLAMWTCTWRWPRRDLSIGVRDVDAGLVSGASERAAWLWRRCWLGGALSLGERLLRHSSLALELT